MLAGWEILSPEKFWDWQHLVLLHSVGNIPSSFAVYWAWLPTVKLLPCMKRVSVDEE